MLRSFLIITLRILWRNKVTSFINIFSLAVGMTAFILIMLYVHHEFSYDKFNENYDRIYRLEAEEYGKLPPVIGDYVRDRVPEVANITRLAGFFKEAFITYKPDNNPEAFRNIEGNFLWADSTTFEVFTFPFIQGDPETALDKPFTMVLTEKSARKLFENANPVGKTVEFNDNQCEITGVIQDVKNAHFDVDGLVSLATMEKRYPDRNLNNAAANTWLWSATYLLMNENIDQGLVEDKINAVLAEINDGNLIDIIFKGFRIRPMKDLYFNGSVTNLQYGKQGNLNLVRSFIFVAVFILVLACVNYINLTTARATLRNKEVAIKKVLGSARALLRSQFVFESILISLFSFLVAFTLVQGLISSFNRLALVDINLAEFNQPIIWVLSIFGMMLIGSISGLYPAIYLTSTKSLAVVNPQAKGFKRSLVRTVLLTFQFSISILLIIATLTSIRQLHYARTIDLGFNQEQIIRIITPSDFPEEKMMRETIKGRLLQNPDIVKVSFTIAQGIGSQPATGLKMEIDGVERTLSFMPIDPDFLDLMEIDIVEGRNLSWDRESEMIDMSKLGLDHVFGAMLNETAVREFDIDSPIGKIVTVGSEYQYRCEIIGIFRDFHSRSVHHEIEPVALGWSAYSHCMLLKISPRNIPATVKFIEDQWKTVYGSAHFNYAFVDETFDQQYKNDELGTKVIGYFSILAIIIACMGLFALSSFMAIRRTKEIGIRKAMGATSQSIFLLLSKEFLKWVLLAIIITSPVALIILKKWLEGFAYRINLGIDIFLLAAVIAIFIALLTVTWQSLKTALANPAQSLRYE